MTLIFANFFGKNLFTDTIAIHTLGIIIIEKFKVDGADFYAIFNSKTVSRV